MLVAGVGAALFCAVPPAVAVTPDAPPDGDLAALGDIWRRQAAAWSKGDAAAYAAIYSPDADLVNIRGEHLHGRGAIASRIQHYFANDLKQTRILRLDEKIRLVSPAMAIIVRKDCVLYGAEPACRPANLSVNSSVMVKRYGQWQIESFHNTLVEQGEERRRPFRLVTAASPAAADVAAAPAALPATPPGGAPPAVQAPPPGTDEADNSAAREALRKLWLRQAETWAKGDAKAYAATYTPDADFVNVTGEHMRTRDVIAQRFQSFMGNQLKNSRIITLEEKVDLVAPTVAVIVRKGCVMFGAETACRPNTFSYNTSIVLRQRDGQWLVRSFHNTLIPQRDPAPRPGRRGATPGATQSTTPS
ncbi:hypothetical protein Sme01_31080 [Sphaerisporangium melleum]|uniref:DUF4440 domain-containing protein n=1 Tax=Sphaerisporangium melleum TaxID=321316 RepID=A0A917R8L4_9ACTN|nr:hypothetical protein GCM10007964_42510 [Sphaerisporangium melleum]GII70632.1 hypothetical protein Sme01_31080 [Sphaerisporangium melleum]